MSKAVIGIHGLANKPTPEVLAEGWEKAIREGLKKNEGVAEASLNFSSVYWADVMYGDVDPQPDLYKPAEEGALKTYNDGFLDDVRACVLDCGGDLFDAMKKYLGMDAIADGVLKAKLKDLSRYYEEADKRAELRNRLENEILKHQESEIMVISHSMGTIIAYDVLRAIGKKHPQLKVEQFVTIGSPLGLPHVKHKIAEENDAVRTPSVVQQWSNFADKRDPVALDVHLADDYAANGVGVQVSDDLVSNDWSGLHHKSYGYLRTPEVSKEIKGFL